MRLIRKIEISYFRSLYKAVAIEAGDLSLLFGRNDSGKSNVLRALNLFFNDETDFDLDLDFLIDFSDTRKEMASKARTRQFISVKITFEVPKNYQKSLGETFAIKRQWNRDGEMSESLPQGSSKGTKIQATKFLSSIDFTYIRAIKDHEVFQNLIQRMYDATAENSGLQSSTRTFIDSIRDETDTLSNSLSAALGSTAKLAAPKDMGLLFRSLDFSHGDDEHSLLLQKGDGIKARHIPELLRYINNNEKNNRLFIWGFEEPENSLDLGAASQEARKFAEFSARNDTQIFVTSHSPAFYLSETNIKQKTVRYFVSKQELSDNNEVEPSNAIKQIRDIDAAEEIMVGANLNELPFIIRELSKIKNERDSAKRQASSLNKIIVSANKPILLVEGAHDKKLFKPKQKHFNHNYDYKVMELGGTSKNAGHMLSKVILQGGISASNPTLFLFDNDRDGRSAFNALGGNTSDPNSPSMFTDNLWRWVIPMTAEFKQFANYHGIPMSQRMFPAEFIFPGQEAAAIYCELLTPTERQTSQDTIHGNYHGNLEQPISIKLQKLEVGTKEWFWSRGVKDEHKEAFYDKITKKHKEFHLKHILEKIAETIC